MIKRVILALALLLAWPAAAGAAVSLAHVAGTSCAGPATSCSATVNSTAGDVVIGLCQVFAGSSGAEGTPSIVAGSAFYTTGEWQYTAAPFYEIYTLAKVTAGIGSTTVTCHTSGVCGGCNLDVFDFTGANLVDCAVGGINLALASSQSIGGFTPTTTSDFVFAFTTVDGGAGAEPALTFSGGGAPTCTPANMPSNADAGQYCVGQLSANTATSVNGTSTASGNHYALNLVAFTAGVVSPFNPALFSPSGMVGLR